MQQTINQQTNNTTTKYPQLNRKHYTLIATTIHLLILLHAIYQQHTPQYIETIRLHISSYGHALPITLIAIAYLTNKLHTHTYLQLLGISQGYLLYDTITMLICNTYGTTWTYNIMMHLLFLIHHITFLSIIQRAHKKPRYVAIGLLAEIATIPMNHVLPHANDPQALQSTHFIIMAILFVITYLLFRVINFGLLAYWMYNDYRNHKATPLEGIITIPLWLINLLWFGLILHGAISKLT